MGPTDAGDREAPDRQTPGFRMPDWETLTALAVLTLLALALRVALDALHLFDATTGARLP